MRYVAMLLIGLFIGSLGAVAAIGALRQDTPYNASIMSVMKHQMGAMHAMREKNQCSSEEIARRLSIMDAIAGEVNVAFLPVGDDEKFINLSADLQDSIAKAQAAEAANCDALGLATTGIGGTCKACHDAFR